MKTSKILLASLLAASALAGTAGAAPSEIYVLGAPAFRQIGTTATVNALKAASGSGATLTEAWTGGGSLTSANSVNIYGGSVNGTSVIVHITYSGSTGAVQSLAAGTTGTSGTTVFPGPLSPGYGHRRQQPRSHRPPPTRPLISFRPSRILG